MPSSSTFFFFFNDTATTEIYTLSLHDALPISPGPARGHGEPHRGRAPGLQRRGEPLQRVHSALPAGADGEGDREGSPGVLRAADAGGGDGAEGGLLEIGG